MVFLRKIIYSATQYWQSSNGLKLKEIKITNFRNWKRERFHWLSGGIYLITVSRTGVLTSSLLTTNTVQNQMYSFKLSSTEKTLLISCSFYFCTALFRYLSKWWLLNVTEVLNHPSDIFIYYCIWIKFYYRLLKFHSV